MSAFTLRIVDGERREVSGDCRLLVTARNGNGEVPFRGFVNQSPVRLPLEVAGTAFGDRYSILVSAKHQRDTGYFPIELGGNRREIFLMQLPRGSRYRFLSYEQATQDPRDLAALIDKTEYDRLKDHSSGQPALACLLNVAVGLEQTPLPDLGEKTPPVGTVVDPQRPLSYFRAVITEGDHPPAQDRFFAWVDPSLVQMLRAVDQHGKGLAGSQFEKAPKALHKGATVSFKQKDFGEANVQLSFHEETRHQFQPWILVEADIDYYHDKLAHTLMEVLPNMLKKSDSRRARVIQPDGSEDCLRAEVDGV